jgi:membrane-associated protein
MELFKHILDLDFVWLINTYQTYIYLILFLVIFIETGIVAMPFLPGDSLLFTAGLFANQYDQATGEPLLNIFYLLILLFIAAVLGDNSNYWIGKNLGLKVMKIKIRGKFIVKQKYLDKTHDFFEEYGTKTIIIARFVPIIRTFAPFVAGIAKMTYRRFISYNIIGGAIWVFSLTCAGYFLGTIPWIKSNIETVAFGIIIISILPIIITVIKSKLKKTV